jgi:hypothetical protein
MLSLVALNRSQRRHFDLINTVVKCQSMSALDVFVFDLARVTVVSKVFYASNTNIQPVSLSNVDASARPYQLMHLVELEV